MTDGNVTHQPEQTFAPPAPSDNGQAFGGGHEATADNDLSDFDHAYDAAEAASGAEVPDGKYQVRVERVDLTHSQAGDPMLKWDLIVLSGQYTGRHVFKNAVITQKSIPFVKGDLKTLNVQLPKFSELPNHLEGLLDKTLEITKRTKGEYTNVYFNRRIDVLAGPDADAMPGEPNPF